MSKEIMQAAGIGTQLENVSNDVYCTVRVDSPAAQARVYNAVNNPTHKVGDVLGKTILVKDIVAEMVEIVNEETGEAVPVPRVVLIDTEGESYQCISTGIIQAVRRLISTFGSPTWEDGLPLIPRQVNLNGGMRMYTLDVDLSAM